VLVAGGTGWAPIWSIACAAKREQPNRELFVIAGAVHPQGLYMRAALDRLVDAGANVIATAETGAADPILPGRPTLYLPSLGPEDTVYVAGPVGLVDAVRQKAREGRARCYADPFLPSSRKVSIVDRIMQMLRGAGGLAAATGLSRPIGRPASPASAESAQDRRASNVIPHPGPRPQGGTPERKRQKSFVR
jgi:3-phenylpropionate/trans-cinnamate dioxygenase ferredoxin reductase subunit